MEIVSFSNTIFVTIFVNHQLLWLIWPNDIHKRAHFTKKKADQFVSGIKDIYLNFDFFILIWIGLFQASKARMMYETIKSALKHSYKDLSNSG